MQSDNLSILTSSPNSLSALEMLSIICFLNFVKKYCVLFTSAVSIGYVTAKLLSLSYEFNNSIIFVVKLSKNVLYLFKTVSKTVILEVPWPSSTQVSACILTAFPKLSS